MGGAKKKIKKIIPKEVKPAVPYVAAYFGGPALGKALFNPAVGTALTTGQLATAKGITAALASKAQGDDTKTALRAATLSAAPDVISGGLGKFEQAYGFGPADAKALSSASQLTKATPMQELATIAGKGKQAIEGAGLLKTVGAQTAVEAGARAVELNEKALRDYEATLREQGIADKDDRRNQIFGYFSRAGYGDDEINSMLNKYGYADGGRVGFEKGGLSELIDYLKEKEEEDENEFKLGDLTSSLEGIKSGFEIATGQPLIGMKPQPTRFGLADGGIPSAMKARKTIAELIQAGVIDEEDVEKAVEQIKMQAINSMKAPGFAEGGLMNLGGREMDMREGGFIPIGAKERADDVPARLSKNEFVMTADAVRAAGDGSINKGAKRMYDLMNKLESKV